MTICRTITLPTGRVSALIVLLLFSSCGPKNQVVPNLTGQMPQKILWAWERPEDLRFLDVKDFGVAFLAQTIILENRDVKLHRRRQPLQVAPETYLIAVTRIETNKTSGSRPDLSPEMADRTAELIKNTLSLPAVRAVQVDFDSVVSERQFYRSLMVKLKVQLPPDTPLTMTALASWCAGDAWFSDFPVDEAVPMVFQMGADTEKIKTYLRNGNDWQEPLCRGSYGISFEEGRSEGMKVDRRIYYFKNSAWTKSSTDNLPVG